MPDFTLQLQALERQCPNHHVQVHFAVPRKTGPPAESSCPAEAGLLHRHLASWCAGRCSPEPADEGCYKWFGRFHALRAVQAAGEGGGSCGAVFVFRLAPRAALQMGHGTVDALMVARALCWPCCCHSGHTQIDAVPQPVLQTCSYTQGRAHLATAPAAAPLSLR